MKTDKEEIVAQLKKQILETQGFKPAPISNTEGFGLGSLEACFPNSVFPTATIHEFLSENLEDAASSEGFISGVMGKLMENGSPCIWISRNRKLFPPSMERFGVDPQQVIFIDLNYEKEILWTTEEALKCEGLACVVAEIPDISFAQSRRLQLATEKSGVTGIILRKQPKYARSATPCTVRWQIKPQPSEMVDEMPGVGNPIWEVNLLKVRNGVTGTFQIQWLEDKFASFDQKIALAVLQTKQAG
ncbi:Error-prone repair protein ImuA [Pedobacter changchengzhani]|uniref:Error-prone repair protein ImuA n=1 Tax=Pedobacter changchengzhani TaxID=2529274 RepID=A0A4R5MLE7_9SPHI|nr:Error-prone repair protein ImuA [Pedobacter changchengzhani]TDG36514.1 Error-prone repair protein ImuA [Pedobacter changchengzhani]